MATGTTHLYNDSEFLFRLQTLIIDGGTTVLRNIFDQQVGNAHLNVILAKEQTEINRLQRKNIIKTSQYDQLYPQGGQLPNITDFDITLIICLLRNLPSLGLNKYCWKNLPQPKDQSTVADIIRLREFRNEIAHITSTVGFDEKRFQTKWDDIEQVLLRLNNGPKPVTDFQQTIDNYKNSSLDPAAEQFFQTKFEEWRELEKALESEINLVKEDMNTAKGEMTRVKEDVKGVKSDIKDVKSDVDKVGKDTKTVKDEITLVKEDVKGVKRHIKDAESAVEEVETKVNLIGEDVKGLKRDIQQGNRSKVERSEEEDKNVLEILQKDLVYLYTTRHTTTSLSPLMNNDAPLLRFFMEPEIVKVEEERSPGNVKENKTPLGPFRNIFYTKKNKPQCSTYLTADAGLGKTAYSKRLALAWCQAKKPLEIEEEIEEEYFSAEEIKDIGEFRFLFLVLLRDSPADKCQIDDLIWEQIISQVNHRSNINRSDLENILAKEKCLIILDGLDEWSHPSTCTERDPIPHCVNSGKLTVLTTTRPWKLSIIGLKSSQIDQKLEITGLNNESSNQLKHSVLSYFMCQRLQVSSLSDGDISKVKSDVQDFNTVLGQKRLSSLEKVPLLLMYMLFLWHYKMDLGETLCELYSSIVELLLSRTLETCESRDVQTSPENTPPYFRKLEHCSRFYTQLTALGRLAYETLLGKTKLENSLVFNSSIAEKYVGKDLKFCFKTGIVSQSQAVQIHPLQQNFKVSFSHKTVQEFFAAIYMSTVSADNTGIMAESVISRCHSIQDILDMSKIFQFICGMNVQLAGCISQETRGIIDHDVRTQEYRNTTDYSSRHPLEDLQDMFVLGCKEMPRENEVSLCLQDLFIGESCREKHYRESLRLLTTTNKHNIKSVDIYMYYMEYTPYNTVQKVLEYFTLNNLENVEKISCVGEDIDDGVIPVLGSQVKCLRLSCLSPSYMSRSLCLNTVRSLQKLEVIGISRFKMSHSELRLLYDYISQRVCLREIELKGLQCTDHEGSCRGPSLDLSQHSQLRELTLDGLPLSELNIKMASLEKCQLRNLSLPARVFHPGSFGQANNKLNTSTVKFYMVRMAASVLNIKMASLEKCRLEKLSLPALVLHPGSFGPANNKLNTSTVELYGVRMAASVLADLVNGVQALPQTVRVKMMNCTIESESEFETVKDQIKTSPYFKLLTDEEVRDRRGESVRVWLEFETIKGGN